MRLLRLQGHGFRSFAESFDFEFPRRDGLFLVRGENRSLKTLGANGAGKSTLFDAVCWCFFGKTTRGLTGPEVESWYDDAPPTLVTVTVTIDDATRTITRTRSPICLTIDGEQAEQKNVDDLLAIDYDRFLQVVILGQFGRMFADMPSAARLELVTSVLGLELWAEASDAAQVTVREHAAAVQKHETEVAKLRERIDVLNEESARTASRAEQWDKDRAKLAAERAERLARGRERVTETKPAVDAAREYLEAAEAKLRKLKEAGAEESDELAQRRVRAQAAHAVATEQLRTARQAVSRMHNLGGECPACQQKIPTSHKREALAAAQAEEAELARALLKAEEKLTAVSQEAKAAMAARREAQEAISEASDAVRAADRELRSRKDALEALRRDVDRLKRTMEEAEAEENPHDAALQEMQEKMTGISARLSEQEAGLVAAKEALQAAEPWPRRFKELRLWIIEDALQELSVAVNSAMVELGLRGWQIVFRVERETRSGTVSRGFEILVHAPGSAADVPWEAWSGGETQRLRIACAHGLAELVRSRMPSTPTWEVWDEPTTHLHHEGVADLVSFFAERAAAGRQVWLIDHRSLDSGAFEGIVTVVKGKRGSRIE